ncbi:hypothetical protein JTB14_002057 [Gonioctena quinquepunctata]|nr:hypothetical protein JTB14_002057 [Gonioctena quinquepunctata]
MQLVYQNQPAPEPHHLPKPAALHLHTNTMYPSAGGAYPPQASHQMTPQQMQAYPPGAPTPNSCGSSTPGQVYAAGGPSEAQTFLHLAQNIQQLSITGNVQGPGFLNTRGPQPQYDYRQRASNNPNCLKSKQFCKGFIMGSSQSSTGTNSPAATVIAGYCPSQNPQQMYRTPSETPPAQFTFPPNFGMPPMMFKPVSNVRASTPGTTRSSRSPTPAGDMTHFDRQRMPLPPNLYQGMPYVVQAPDPRLIPGRGQPNIYRQAVPPQTAQPTSYSQGSDTRSRKNRKTKTNKQSGLPPSGK